VEAFGDAVIAGKAPHSGDFFLPGIESIAQLNQRSESCLLQFADGAEQAGEQLAALFANIRLGVECTPAVIVPFMAVFQASAAALTSAGSAWE